MKEFYIKITTIIAVTILVIGLMFYLENKPSENNQSQSMVLGVTNNPDEKNPVWNLNIPSEIKNITSHNKIEQLFPQEISERKLTNLYPELGPEKIYPTNSKFVYKSIDPNIKDILVTEGYFSAYLNLENKLPISLKIYKLSPSTSIEDLTNSLNYMFDYENDMYERIFFNSQLLKLWGGYVPWTDAEKFPLDHSSKITNFVIIDPENLLYIEIGISHDNNLNEVNEILENFIKNLSIDDTLVAVDSERFLLYPIYKDNYISRLSQ